MIKPFSEYIAEVLKDEDPADFCYKTDSTHIEIQI
jgi:hypothetical protein